MAVSNLYWRTGFGWGTVTLAGAGAFIWVNVDGTVRYAGLALILIALLHAVRQYRRWNGTGWRKVHQRAMLAYARTIGTEVALAEAEKREVDRSRACRALGLMIAGPSKEREVDAMVEFLKEEKGIYLAHLVRDHHQELFPGKSLPELLPLLVQLGKVELGPQLVVANVVENTFGRLEAAKYAVALLDGEAS